MSSLARQLCMHERTLHRRLQESGTTYRRELENLRYQMARQMLVDSAMPHSKDRRDARLLRRDDLHPRLRTAVGGNAERVAR